jgi:hypothetical protein
VQPHGPERRNLWPPRRARLLAWGLSVRAPAGRSAIQIIIMKAGACVRTVSIVCGRDGHVHGWAQEQQTGAESCQSWAASSGPGGVDPGRYRDPLVRTRLTGLTVVSTVLCILMTLLPARPSRAKTISMPNERRGVCTRRSRPASARGFLGQPSMFETPWRE